MIILDESLRDSDSLSSMLVEMYANVFREDTRLHILCDNTGNYLGQLGAAHMAASHSATLESIPHGTLPESVITMLNEDLDHEVAVESGGTFMGFDGLDIQKVSVCSICLNKLPLYRVSIEFTDRGVQSSFESGPITNQYGYAVVDLKTGLFLDYNSQFVQCAGYEHERIERARYTEVGQELAVTHGLLYSSDPCFYQATLNPKNSIRYWTLSQKYSVQGRECLKLWILPLNTSHGSAENTDLSKTDSKGDEKIRVLVVDDEILLQQTCSALLEHLNCSVQTALNGKEALELLELNAFDLVLLDMNMPFLNGFDTARLIRNSEKAYRHIQIVAMTGANTESETSQAQFKHFDSILNKPFALQQIVECLDDFKKKKQDAATQMPIKQDVGLSSRDSDFKPTLTLKQYKDQPDILGHLRLTFIQCLSNAIQELENTHFEHNDIEYLLSQIAGMALNMGAQTLYIQATKASTHIQNWNSEEKNILCSSILKRAKEAIEFYKDIDWNRFLEKKDHLDSSFTIAA